MNKEGAHEDMPSMTSPQPRTPTGLFNQGLVLVSLAFLVTMIGTTLPTPLYPLYQHQFHISQLMVTVIFAVYAAGTIAALLLCGSWSDQIGRRVIVYAALAFSALSAIIFAWGASLPWILVARVLSGISAGLVTGAATIFVIELAPAQYHHKAALLAAVINMGGLGLGPLLGGLLAQYAPWPTHLVFILHLVLIALAAAGLAMAPETVKVRVQPRLRPQGLALPHEVRSVFLPAAIAGVAGFAVLGFFNALTPAFMGSILGLHNLALTGIVVFVVFAASTVGQMALGLLPQRLALPAGCVLLACGALVVAAAIITSSLALLIAGAILAGSGQGLGFRAGLAAVTQASPEARRAEVISSFFVVLYTAISVPVIVLGLWSDALGLRSAGTGFAVIVAVLSLLALVSLVWERRRH